MRYIIMYFYECVVRKSFTKKNHKTPSSTHQSYKLIVAIVDSMVFNTSIAGGIGAGNTHYL